MSKCNVFTEDHSCYPNGFLPFPLTWNLSQFPYFSLALLPPPLRNTPDGAGEASSRKRQLPWGLKLLFFDPLQQMQSLMLTRLPPSEDPPPNSSCSHLSDLYLHTSNQAKRSVWVSKFNQMSFAALRMERVVVAATCLCSSGVQAEDGEPEFICFKPVAVEQMLRRLQPNQPQL